MALGYLASNRLLHLPQFLARLWGLCYLQASQEGVLGDGQSLTSDSECPRVSLRSPLVPLLWRISGALLPLQLLQLVVQQI